VLGAHHDEIYVVATLSEGFTHEAGGVFTVVADNKNFFHMKILLWSAHFWTSRTISLLFFSNLKKVAN